MRRELLAARVGLLEADDHLRRGGKREAAIVGFAHEVVVRGRRDSNLGRLEAHASVAMRAQSSGRGMQSILKEENPGRNRGFAVVLSARRYSTGGMQKFGQIPSARAEGQSPQVSSAPQTTDWMFLMRSGFGPLGCTDAGPDTPLSSPF